MELKYLGLPTDSEDILIAKKVALVASIGVFLFPALRMLFSNRVITFSGFAILIWYYIELPLDITSQSVRFRHFVLMVATFLMLFWDPFVKLRLAIEIYGSGLKNLSSHL